MKRPKKPIVPYKPSPPLKTLVRYESIPMQNWCSIQDMLDELPPGVSPKDVSIEGTDYTEYGDSYVKLTGSYAVRYPNPNYDTQYATYKEALKVYKAAMIKLKPKLDAYAIEKAKYDEYERARIKERRETIDKEEFAKLKKRCEQLEAKLAKK